MLIRATTVWVVILVLAILNGVLREAVLFPSFGMRTGFIASGLILCCVVFAVAYFSISWIGSESATQHLLVGFLWLALTLSFEFSFGLSRGLGLDEILSAYSFQDWNLWPLVLLLTFFAPLLAAKCKARSTP
ncbi:MAG TPA: hypothetical protein PKC89_10985 [Pyrinomonadaceae bacterium]|nr:hypothetical protein [Pyrinomonadaceae bacterium]